MGTPPPIEESDLLDQPVWLLCCVCPQVPEPVGDFQPSYYPPPPPPPPQPQFLPPGFLSALHFLPPLPPPPPPASFSLTVLSDTDKEATGKWAPVRQLLGSQENFLEEGGLFYREGKWRAEFKMHWAQG